MTAAECADPPARGQAVPAAAVFAALWDTLADLLGTAATATLLRRALRVAAAEGADVDGVTIKRDDLTHQYELPESWRRADDAAARAALAAITAGLRPLLIELTGSVVVRRIERVEGLREMVGEGEPA